MKRIYESDHVGAYAGRQIKKSTVDADSVMKNRAMGALLALPRGAMTAVRQAEDQAQEIGEDSFELGQTQQERSEEFNLPRTEFRARQRYRDTSGTSFAPMFDSDPLYQSLNRHGLVDDLDPEDAKRASERKGNARGLPRPKKRRVLDTAGTTGKYLGRVAFFAKLKGDGRIQKWPRGMVEFIDPSNDTLFTGVVKSSMFRGRSKSGYIILEDVVEWGQMSNPAEFAPAQRRNDTE